MSANTSDHVYEAIIRSDSDSVWKALTDSTETQKYFFHTRIESDWKPGSSYRGYGPDGSLSSDGEIVEIEAGSHFKTTFKPVWLGDNGQAASTVSWNVESLGPATLVKLTHSGIDDETFDAGQLGPGWVYVVSSLKSLLETSEPLPDLFG